MLETFNRIIEPTRFSTSFQYSESCFCGTQQILPYYPIFRVERHKVSTTVFRIKHIILTYMTTISKGLTGIAIICFT